MDPNNPFPVQLLGTVGWGQVEWYGNPCGASIMQVAVKFETAPLDRIRDKRIQRVILTYDEAPGKFCQTVYGFQQNACWQSGSGTAQNKPEGCVIVRVPSGPWISDRKRLLPVLGAKPEVRRVSTRECDVTEPFRWQKEPGAAPLNGNGGTGFVLTGSPTSLDQLTAQDNTNCYSAVTNIRLLVTYTVSPGCGPGMYRAKDGQCVPILR
jgi:hypothetical protein